jgi:hypothetical protein
MAVVPECAVTDHSSDRRHDEHGRDPDDPASPAPLARLFEQDLW